MKPGQDLIAELAGSVTLLVQVVDDVTGKPVERYSLHLRREHELTLIQMGDVRERREIEAKVGPGGDLEVFPIPQTLIVDAPGQAREELTLTDLVPGETRELTVRLRLPAQLTGRVVRAGGEPVAGASLQLVEPGVQPWVEGSAVWRSGGLVSRVLWTRTDDLGRFAFEDLSLLHWTLHAWEHRHAVATLELELTAGEQRDDALVELPPDARIRGRVLGPRFATSEGLELGFEPASAPRVTDPSDRVPTLVARVDEDRTFDSGPLPAGAVGVHLRLPDLVRARGWGRGADHLLEELVLLEGEERFLTIDLGQLWPARLRVLLEGPDVGRAALEVSLRPMSVSPARLARGATVRADAAGLAELGLVAAGEYQLLVQLGDAPGEIADPSPVLLAPGEQLDRRVTVPRLVRGVLKLADATSGEPLLATALKVTGFDFTTDAEGRLELELFFGIYRIARVAPQARTRLQHQGPSVTFEWTATGPPPEPIALEPPP